MYIHIIGINPAKDETKEFENTWQYLFDLEQKSLTSQNDLLGWKEGFFCFLFLNAILHYMILEPKKIIPLLGIQHGMTVLDIGSSVGFWVKPISHIVGNSGKVIAVDNHAEIIQRLNNDVHELGMTNVHAITGDIHNLSNLSLSDHICDRVLCIRMISVIEHDLETKIKELMQFIKDDGKLIIIDAMHYQNQLMTILRANTKEIEYIEISEVAQRTDNHFFGVSINSVRD